MCVCVLLGFVCVCVCVSLGSSVCVCHEGVMWLSILESCQVYVVFVFMGALRVNSSLDT